MFDRAVKREILEGAMVLPVLVKDASLSGVFASFCAHP